MSDNKLAVIVAIVLGLLSLALGGLGRADCQATGEAAAETLREKRERRQENSGFAEPAATRETLRSCLSALEDWAVVVSPVLGPLPDLGGVTEELCQKGREFLLDQAPPEISPAIQASGGKIYGRRLDIGREVRDALE
ncbi:MAG: hypothetical protein LBU69_06275 [Deltaproteobacteria bacterium]|jgi:hypothetical protein|nr:hypothetical protein [Deltaproteobacteria bacterium]